jgi:hypothetical protein
VPRSGLVQQGARANALQRHASGFENEYGIEAIERNVSWSTSRAAEGRGSSLTLVRQGKQGASCAVKFRMFQNITQ